MQFCLSEATVFHSIGQCRLKGNRSLQFMTHWIRFSLAGKAHSYKDRILSRIHCCSEVSRASEELASDNCAASQELVQLREDKASQSQNLEALQVLSRVATFRSLCPMHCNVLHTSALGCMQAKASHKDCNLFDGCCIHEAGSLLIPKQESKKGTTRFLTDLQSSES